MIPTKTKPSVQHSISLTFEEINLPPFRDVLILGKQSPFGKTGIFKSFELLRPNMYELLEVEDQKVEAILIHKKILLKLSKDSIISLLQEKVFPYVTEEEILKVDFHIAVSHLIVEEPNLISNESD